MLKLYDSENYLEYGGKNFIIEGTIEADIGVISGWVLKDECKQEEYILL